jgi:signal transduction histidine kinase
VPLRDAEFALHLIQSMRSGLVAIDETGAIAAWNAEARRILGEPGDPASTPLGRPCREALHEQPTLARLLLDALEGNQLPSRAELVLESDGERSSRTIGFTLTALRDQAGSRRGAAILFRDLTPYERMDEQDRLRERLAALGEMAAGLAHEIRNPLAGMEVIVGLLRRRLADRPEERELLEELGGEARRVARAVSESLEFVRPASLDRQPVDPVKLMEKALAQAASRTSFDGAIEREYPEPAPTLIADAESLRAAWANLIVNAFEAMQALDRTEGHRLRLGMRVEPVRPGPPSVRVERHRISVLHPEPDSHQLVVWFEDTGPGVPVELRERIFYPFFTTKRGGTGVGLASVQKTVVGHGGHIEVEGQEGRGAVFRLQLPLGEAHPR